MSKKMIAREWLIFVITCVAYFVLGFVGSLFGLSFPAIVGLAHLGIPLFYLLICAVRLTIWAVRRAAT